jgi:hypothetical protein
LHRLARGSLASGWFGATARARATNGPRAAVSDERRERITGATLVRRPAGGKKNA